MESPAFLRLFDLCAGWYFRPIVDENDSHSPTWSLGRFLPPNLFFTGSVEMFCLRIFRLNSEAILRVGSPHFVILRMRENDKSATVWVYFDEISTSD